ncbi:MAG: hypothetical protein RIS28_1523, partial [Bacteroidota bacterium]
MAHYQIEENLSTTTNQKIVSWLISLVASAIILCILWFVHISIPNPPFENKKGALILDFGMVEETSAGRPTDGGPSPTAPKLGGDPSQGPSNNQPQSGGVGPVVTSEAQSQSPSLPPIDPPSSDRPASDNPKIKVDFSKIGKRGGKGGEGDPNGVRNGIGSTGSGKGGNNGGVTGNYGDRVTGNKGGANFSAKFTKYSMSSDFDNPATDAYGKIIARVRVECNGTYRVVEWNVSGTTWNGSD